MEPTFYTKPGTKVIYKDTGGYPVHLRHAREHLEKGKIYTIKESTVDTYSTIYIMLEEVPGSWFIVGHFEEVAPTDTDFDKKVILETVRTLSMIVDETLLLRIKTQWLFYAVILLSIAVVSLITYLALQ